MEQRDKREYKRGHHFTYDVRVSEDGNFWAGADAENLSSGGLKLLAGQAYEVGRVLHLDIVVHGFMVEFPLKTRGEVRRKEQTATGHQYGIAFLDLTRDQQIRIDEIVRKDRPITGEHYQPE